MHKEFRFLFLYVFIYLGCCCCCTVYTWQGWKDVISSAAFYVIHTKAGRFVGRIRWQSLLYDSCTFLSILQRNIFIINKQTIDAAVLNRHNIHAYLHILVFCCWKCMSLSLLCTVQWDNLYVYLTTALTYIWRTYNISVVVVALPPEN